MYMNYVVDSDVVKWLSVISYNQYYYLNCLSVFYFDLFLIQYSILLSNNHLIKSKINN